jgi:signal transduction histidine kinase/Tfp pilus assembly protein PilF
VSAGRQFLIAVLAGAMLALMLGAAGTASPPPSQPAEDWAPFERLAAQSEKAMMADPATALARARAATNFAEHHRASSRYAEAAAMGWWLAAESLTRLNRAADASAALDRAARLAGSDGKITKLDGDVALARARIADGTGDIAQALKSLQKAYAIYARIGNARSESIALQGLGSIYGKAHAFAKEIAYYRKASQVYSGDPALLLSAANNLGFALQQLGRYDESVANFRDALKIAETLKSPLLENTVLTNLAFVYAKQGKLADAEQAATRALKLAKSAGDTESVRFVWGVKAEIAYRKGALSAAATDLDNAFRGIDLKTTIPPFRDMHEIAYKVYRDQGNAPLSLAHLEAFKRLDDKGRMLVASANLALMGAQFDFTTQKLEIEQLKSAQLKRDISLKESRAATQKVLFLALFAALLVVIAWFTWRHVLMHRHRDAISRKNTELRWTLGERDHEIVRRTEVETQLRLAMETALQANRAKNHFLANMSHELRTPLNAIIGFSDLLLTGPLPEKPRDYARNILQGGRHLLANLNDVLDMARIEAGKIVLHEDVIELDELVESAVSDISSAATANKSIRVDHVGLAVALRCDKTRIRQVLANLLSNAVKFSGDNGRIEIGASATPNGLDLIVQDNGPGIPRDKIDLILEPFGQGESAYARTHGGMGLGLPIVKSLVEMHGGRFFLENAAGGGTIARVHLPGERIVEMHTVREAALVS